VVEAEGKEKLERVTITDGSRQWTRECEMLACGFHLVPNLELPRLLGCQIVNGYVRVDPCQRTSVAHVACVGELTGIGGLEKALLEGQIAGSLAVGNLPRALQLQERLQKQLRFARRLDKAFQLRPELRALAAADTLVCRCEDVSYEKLRETGSWRSAKLQTRCGMGACQGRVCGAASEFLFGWKQDGVRPPIYPSTVETMAAEMTELEK
jgi:NADPH-dependent 2,4-dienoyl-CoA reductase/sulfur reductase-like enzyme